MSEDKGKDNENALSRKKIIVNLIVVLIIGLVINIVISFFADFQETFATLKTINLLFVVKVFVVFSMAYLIDLIRLYIVTLSFHKKIKFKDALYNTISYYFMSNITPMASGGQPYQIYHLTKLGIESTLATNIVLSRLVENLLFSSAVILIFIRRVMNILSRIGTGKYILIIGIIAALGFSALLILLFLNPKLIYKLFNFLLKIFPLKNKSKFEQRLQKLENWLEELKLSIKTLWIEKAHIVTIDFILGGFIVFFHSLGLHITLSSITSGSYSILEVFILFIIMNFVVYYIPTPGSSGGVEALYGIVLASFMPGRFVSTTVLLWRFATYYLQIAFEGVILLMTRTKEKRFST
ncbi:hypothetical protein HWHPT5561_04900 [Petrotoga sp. HWH.PT.55.6.1]|uniref:lysylphosphatidylglycerol synthase transmembrane domain-containing protein n=1 Tax=unclassified Petrotoga TaxID=2620614 RepID=UPI000CA05C72|nr:MULTISPECIES: lysylphosphatidylglycerol synthase transmembrane domain-containing protein [unclassified Petrotoga]PNR93128.1 hypothetical protein X926_04185 [Petrotoga sp. HWHPT.55.6.3]RPD35949.1 hypothetical protein HWHPT5561_04900 [Petrotoga sp. HWH.PT.55.6.1]